MPSLQSQEVHVTNVLEVEFMQYCHSIIFTVFLTEASFMLYNYARLCSIFDHFEQCVKQGDVAPLPPAEDVDFSLLRNDVSYVML